MANQVTLTAEARGADQIGKGAAGRLRKDGRIPAIVYGSGIDSLACSVDALEMYHAMRTEAGLNVLIRLQVDGEEHLTLVRDTQRHPVRGDMTHVDFVGVDADQPISAEIRVRIENEDAPASEGGVLNHILYTVPIYVKPLEIPNEFVLDVDGMVIGDVLRVEDLLDQLPEGAEFEIEEERTVVTVNAPAAEIEEPEPELEEGEEGELLEGEEGEPAEGEEGEEGAEGEAAEGDEGGEEE